MDARPRVCVGTLVFEHTHVRVQRVSRVYILKYVLLQLVLLCCCCCCCYCFFLIIVLLLVLLLLLLLFYKDQSKMKIGRKFEVRSVNYLWIIKLNNFSCFTF